MFSTVNLARIAKVVALLLFVLPWVTVSCGETPLLTMTGIDMVTGNVEMSGPMANMAQSPAPAGGKGDGLVIIGMVLILLSLAASFLLKGRMGALTAMLGSLCAACALAYTVLIRFPAEARAGAAPPGGSGGATMGGPDPAQIAEMIRVNIEIGFYLTLAALAAAVVLNFLAMKGSAAPAVAAAADPPADPPAV